MTKASNIQLITPAQRLPAGKSLFHLWRFALRDKPQTVSSQAELERQRDYFIQKLVEVWRKQKRKEKITEVDNTDTVMAISATIVKDTEKS
jgi:hypothetical protein